MGFFSDVFEAVGGALGIDEITLSKQLKKKLESRLKKKLMHLRLG